MKKILLPYLSAGHGHLSFARAIEQAIKRHRPDWETRLSDTGKEIPNQRLDELFVGQWKKILALPKWLQNLSFLVEPIFTGALGWRFIRSYIRQAVPGAAQMIREYKPDAILPLHWACGHVFSAARTYLAAQPGQEATEMPPLWYLFTELGGAYKLVDCGADTYFALSTEAEQGLAAQGIVESSIIKVQPVVQSNIIHQKTRKKEARQELGIDPEIFTLIFSLGGEGLGSITHYLDRLYAISPRSLQVVVLTGRNTQLYTSLKKRYPDCPGKTRIIPQGYLENMNLVYQAADLSAGKCGTSYALETVWTQTPHIVCTTGGPNERHNAKYLVRRHYGWYKHGSRGFAKLVQNCAQENEEYQAALIALSQKDNINGADQIAQYCISQLESS